MSLIFREQEKYNLPILRLYLEKRIAVLPILIKKESITQIFCNLGEKVGYFRFKVLPSNNIYISPYIFSKVKKLLNPQKKVEKIGITALLSIESLFL